MAGLRVRGGGTKDGDGHAGRTVHPYAATPVHGTRTRFAPTRVPVAPIRVRAHRRDDRTRARLAARAGVRPAITPAADPVTDAIAPPVTACVSTPGPAH